ncbi:hypothetical protein [Latilactobacillus fuchuensis]|uniref:hypothetical protein n=1 Tax=Latilactobacillus fuchuensis TaxID=164393 RepID=UPI0039AF2C93
MLDDRLLGQRFSLPDDKPTGTIAFFGVLYHYQVTGEPSAGLLVEVTAVTPLYLVVIAHQAVLDY